MIPIYSIGSWFSLRFHDKALYIETFRDCYESYVIYCFYYYLVSVLGGEDELVMILKDKSVTRGVHLRPVRWFVSPWLMGQPIGGDGKGGIRWASPFLTKCKFGVLQYVLLKFLTAIVTVILQVNDKYVEGDWSLTGAFFWLTSVIFWSQCWALYCLAFFYFATKNELAYMRPVGKFLSVKALEFFTWWQGVGVSILYYFGWIDTFQEIFFRFDGDLGWSSEDVAKGIQVSLCASVLHCVVYPKIIWKRFLILSNASDPNAFPALLTLVFVFVSLPLSSFPHTYSPPGLFNLY